MVNLDPNSNEDIGAWPFVPALLAGKVSAYSHKSHQILVQNNVFWAPSIPEMSVVFGGFLHPGAYDADGGGADHLYPVAKVFTGEAVGWLMDAEQSKGGAKLLAGFVVFWVDLRSPNRWNRRGLDSVTTEWNIQAECYPDGEMVSDGVPDRGVADSRLCDDGGGLRCKDVVDG